MEEKKYGMIRSIFRFFVTWNWKTARRIDKAADAQWTKDVDSIAAGFAQTSNDIVGRYNAIKGAITTFETGVEQKRMRINDPKNGLMVRIQRKEQALNGALAQIEKAQAANDPEAEKKHRAAAATFKKEADDLHRELEDVEASLKSSEKRREELFGQMQALKREKEALKDEEADAIADFVSDTAIKNSLESLNGMTLTVDRRPIDAIREARKQLRAETNVAKRINDAETTNIDEQYMNAGNVDSAESDIDKMLAGRKAARAEKTGETDAPTSDRPKV
jgi:chromosome segregation ATPase